MSSLIASVSKDGDCKGYFLSLYSFILVVWQFTELVGIFGLVSLMLLLYMVLVLQVNFLGFLVLNGSLHVL